MTSARPITSDALLDAAQERTGLARNQLLMMVAKSAAVRHVATQAAHGQQFVLKGGTLLTHVYRSPRQSIADADYLHLSPDAVNVPEIEDALRFSEGNFTLEPIMRFQGNKFVGTGMFTFDDIRITRSRDRELHITVSIRKGERLDPPTVPLYYHDPTLAEQPNFEVQGLTINELSAEKILGWCSKDLRKHLIDLAYVARDFHEDVDHDLVANRAVLGRSCTRQRRGSRTSSTFSPPSRTTV